MSKRVLITGASGFIGRNLAELLTGYTITAPTRAELDLVSTEAVEAYLKEHHFDVVIHAATGRSNRKTTAPDLFKNNCRMFFNFARHPDLYGRMLHFGSGAEFDRRAYQPLMPESYFDTSVPEDDYGFAKYIAAKYTELSPNIVNLRLFGVFGKYEAWEVSLYLERLLPRFARHADHASPEHPLRLPRCPRSCTAHRMVHRQLAAPPYLQRHHRQTPSISLPSLNWSRKSRAATRKFKSPKKGWAKNTVAPTRDSCNKSDPSPSATAKLPSATFTIGTNRV